MQADATDPAVAAEMKKRRSFRTFSYRGVELDKLLDLRNEEVSLRIIQHLDIQC
jgi:small subunit ribosomal protein S15e